MFCVVVVVVVVVSYILLLEPCDTNGETGSPFGLEAGRARLSGTGRIPQPPRLSSGRLPIFILFQTHIPFDRYPCAMQPRPLTVWRQLFCAAISLQCINFERCHAQSDYIQYDLETRQSPALVSTTSFLRRGYQACMYKRFRILRQDA